MEFDLGYTPAVAHRIRANVGAGMDIPTGNFVTGARGESICMGGLPQFSAITGKGNVGKSTLGYHMILTATLRLSQYSIGNTHCTEGSTEEQRINSLAYRTGHIQEDIIDSGRWMISDSVGYSANKWFDAFREKAESKLKNKKLSLTTPFLDRDKKSPFKISLPTTSFLDSMSTFHADNTIKMLNKHEVGAEGGDLNTVFLRDGWFKKLVVQMAPDLTAKTNTFLLVTAHLGKHTMQAGGPPGSGPEHSLSGFKNGDKFSGMTNDINYLTPLCLYVTKTKALVATDGNGPLYPRDSLDKLKYDRDLQEQHITILRGKAGPSSTPMIVLYSQSEGVLPYLTNFHNAKNTGEGAGWGFQGNAQNYQYDIYPDVNLSRTTVRSKLDEDPLLCRAAELTHEILQLTQLKRFQYRDVLCDMPTLYTDLKAMGYDWKVLLNTRGWWTTLENEPGNPPFLSCLDLLRMRKGLYHPYWMNEDKTVKDEYKTGVYLPAKEKK